MYEYQQSDVYEFATVMSAETNQKGDELHFKLCPYCNGGGKDKETFAINLQSGAFQCLRASCGKKGHFVELARDFSFRLSDANKVFKKLPQQKIEIRDKAVEYLATRGISKAVVERYRITTKKSDDSVIVFPFYDDANVLTFVKYRNTVNRKGFGKEWCEKDTMPILFGMAQCEDFTALVITEGQIDSLTLAECGIKNAVSVPTGALGFTWLRHCWDWVHRFERVVVFGDFEHGSMSLLEKLQTALKMPVYAVQECDYLHEKDANAILAKYGKDAVVKAVVGAKMQELKTVMRLSEVKSVNFHTMPKIKTGIETIDKAIGGIFYGQVVLLTGRRGDGKSTFMSQLVAEAIEQGVGAFVYSGELPAYHFKNWLDCQIAGFDNLREVKGDTGVVWHVPRTGVVDRINRWYRDKAFIFDNDAVGTDEYAGLLPVIEDCIRRYDTRLICIDNLMTALDDDFSRDVYRQQSVFAKSVKAIAKKYNVAVILVVHPRKGGLADDTDSVNGSGDITNAADIVMWYKRAEDDVPHDSELLITKNRLTGKVLKRECDWARLVYSAASKRIADASSDFNKAYSCFAEDDTHPYFDINAIVEDDECPFD